MTAAVWHPLMGNGFYFVSADELAATLEGGEVTQEIDLSESVGILFGYLSADHGSYAFSCVQDRASGRNVLAIPERFEN